MDQPQSVRPASASRPVRRSLAEFVRPPDGAPGEVSSAAQPLPTARSASAPQPDGQPPSAVDRERRVVIHAPLNEVQKADASCVGQSDDLDDTTCEDNALFHQFEDMMSAATRTAKDYRFWMLEYMKINMATALNCASGIAGVNVRTVSAAHPDVPEHGENTHLESDGKTTPTVAEVADDYRVKAVEVMTDNINTTLEYAQRLAKAKTPSEFIALSTGHAYERFDSFMKQTTELGLIAQRLTTSDDDG